MNKEGPQSIALLITRADLDQSSTNIRLREKGLMVPIFAISTQNNLLIYVGGGGFVLLGAFYFGRIVTFFLPNNPLIKKGKKENEQLIPKQKEFVEFFEKASNQAKENNDA